MHSDDEEEYNSESDNEEITELYNLEKQKQKNLLHICESLILTYDPRYIEGMSEELKQSFLLEAIKGCKNDVPRPVLCDLNARPVLCQLIYNYYYNQTKKPVADYITGPMNLTIHLSRKYKKLVYIFGEYHQDNVNCDNFPEISSLSPKPVIMTIDDYLKQLFDNSDSFFDFFAEVPSTGRNKMKYDDPNLMPFLSENFRLNKIFQNFKHCIVPETRHSDNCKLGRFHFLDVRDPLSDELSFITNQFLRAPLKDTLKIYQIQIILLNLYKFAIEDRLYEYFHDHIWNNVYTKHEKNKLNISNPDLAKNIEDFINEEIKDNMKILSANGDITKHLEQIILWINTWNMHGISMQDLDPNYSSNLELSYKFCAYYFTRISAIIADTYLLCRVFKQFNLERIPFYGAYEKDQPAHAHNIIIYSGDIHSQRYRKFLNLLDFDEIGKTGQADPAINSCIDMRYIQQPFFSVINKPRPNDYNFNYDMVYDDEYYKNYMFDSMEFSKIPV